MTDIIARLRRRSLYLDGSSATRVMEEAAEEIERLRTALKAISEQDYDAGYSPEEYARHALEPKP